MSTWVPVYADLFEAKNLSWATCAIFVRLCQLAVRTDGIVPNPSLHQPSAAHALASVVDCKLPEAIRALKELTHGNPPMVVHDERGFHIHSWDRFANGLAG